MGHIVADEKLMRAALIEARRGAGRTSPNPAVGAILVINRKIVSKGHHSRAGAPHAEIECLRQFRRPIPKDATLYVTLEPCATTGRTGPCTNAIIDAGVRHVVIGTTDPNPKNARRGIAALERAGISVRSGIIERECLELNEGYNKWITSKRPFVIAKCGMTLDGRLTAAPGESRWITSAASRRHSHQLRAQVDAILIGANTLRTDNPHLTIRGIRAATQPWRIVLSRSGRLPKSAHLFVDRFAHKTIVCRGTNLENVMRRLGEKEITSVLIEGGGDVLGQALDQGLIDKVQLYLGASLTGGSTIAFAGRGAGSTIQALRLCRIRYEQIGNDVCVSGYPAKGAGND